MSSRLFMCFSNLGFNLISDPPPSTTVGERRKKVPSENKQDTISSVPPTTEQNVFGDKMDNSEHEHAPFLCATCTHPRRLRETGHMDRTAPRKQGEVEGCECIMSVLYCG